MGGGGPPYSVFIGNVPYDATEERLRDMFSEVGPVHDLRCVSHGRRKAHFQPRPLVVFLPRVATAIAPDPHPYTPFP